MESEFTYGGKFVAEILKTNNVEFVFTLTGGHTAPILVACKHIGIKVIDVRDEATTVFAADAVSRLTKNVGVAWAISWPLLIEPPVEKSLTPRLLLLHCFCHLNLKNMIKKNTKL